MTRIGDKVLQETSGGWKGSQVGRRQPGFPAGPPQVRQDARHVVERALRTPQEIRTHAIRAAEIRGSQMLDELREALYHEANEEGEWQQAISDTQDHVREAMAGCAAMLREIEAKS